VLPFPFAGAEATGFVSTGAANTTSGIYPTRSTNLSMVDCMGLL